MPDVYGPFTGATMGQAGWFRDRGPADPTGVAGPPSTTVAGGALGFTSNGLTGTIALGRAHVRGAYYERTSTAWSYTHPANTNANPRIDRYVLRRDLTAGTVVPAVLQGTPAATPAAPAVTQTEDGVWELPLFQVTVPANSGTVLTAVDERVWINNGVVLPVATLLTPPSGWSHYSTPGTTGANNFERLNYRIVNDNEVIVHGMIKNSGATSTGTDLAWAPAGWLPAAIRPGPQVTGFITVISGPIVTNGVSRLDFRSDGSGVWSPAVTSVANSAWLVDMRWNLINV